MALWEHTAAKSTKDWAHETYFHFYAVIRHIPTGEEPELLPEPAGEVQVNDHL